MAIPWLVVLQSVPWAQVISNAPKVAEGAKKLWNTVARNAAPADPSTGRARAEVNPADATPQGLQARLAALEVTVSDLHAQMLASSELIKALAEQNTQLVTRVEANRVRALRIGVALVVVAVIAIAGVVMSVT